GRPGLHTAGTWVAVAPRTVADTATAADAWRRVRRCAARGKRRLRRCPGDAAAGGRRVPVPLPRSASTHVPRQGLTPADDACVRGAAYASRCPSFRGATAKRTSAGA